MNEHAVPASAVHHVTCGLFVRAKRVLLAHRSEQKTWYPNVWDLPGGHVEPGEDSRVALVREMREELGVEINAPIGTPLLRRHDSEMLFEVWLVESWSGEVENAAPDEHDALGWFELREALAVDLADPEYPALITRALG